VAEYAAAVVTTSNDGGYRHDMQGHVGVERKAILEKQSFKRHVEYASN
jgi:hypothetical protein